MAADNGYLMRVYGALAIRYNNLLLWGRCTVTTHNTGKRPAGCPVSK